MLCITTAAEVLQLGRKTHGQLPGQCELDGGQVGACYAGMRMPLEGGKGRDAPSLPAAPKANRVERTAEQERLVPVWNHVVRGGRVVRATLPTDPQLFPVAVTEIPTRSEVTNISKKSKTEKSAPKVTVGPKQAQVTKLKKPAKPAKPSQPKTKELVVPPQPNQSPIEISDLIDLTLNVRVKLTCKILISFPTLPSGLACSRVVIKAVALLVAECGSTA